MLVSKYAGDTHLLTLRPAIIWPVQGCSVGTVSLPLFSAETKICIQQSFFVHPKSHECIIYDGAQQAEQLMTELNCMCWGSALICSAYEFMAGWRAELGSPTFGSRNMLCIVWSSTRHHQWAHGLSSWEIHWLWEGKWILVCQISEQ